MTPEQNRLLREDRAYCAAFNEICAQEGMPAAASVGFGSLMETVICELHARDFAYCITQTCKRVVPARTGKIYGGRIAMSHGEGTPAIESSHTKATRDSNDRIRLY